MGLFTNIIMLKITTTLLINNAYPKNEGEFDDCQGKLSVLASVLNYILMTTFVSFISCLINCANRVVPTLKLSLVLQCAECATLDEMTYQWSLYSRQGTDYIEEDLSQVSASGEC